MRVFDTTILVDYLREYPPAVNFLEEEFSRPGNDACISAITAIEIIAGAKDRSDYKILTRFLDMFSILDVNEQMSKNAFALTVEYTLAHAISVPDIFIASTVLEHKARFFTRNLKDFVFIPKLKVESPY